AGAVAAVAGGQDATASGRQSRQEQLAQGGGVGGIAGKRRNGGFVVPQRRIGWQVARGGRARRRCVVVQRRLHGIAPRRRGQWLHQHRGKSGRQQPGALILAGGGGVGDRGRR